MTATNINRIAANPVGGTTLHISCADSTSHASRSDTPRMPWNNASQKRTLQRTVVLTPDELGGLLCYLRTASSPLTQGPIFTETTDLCRFLAHLEPDVTLILCGFRHAKEVAWATLRDVDLYIVPCTWLRDLPTADPQRRAALAAKLVTAHRRSPIECRFAEKPDDDIPF